MAGRSKESERNVREMLESNVVHTYLHFKTGKWVPKAEMDAITSEVKRRKK
jgi:hypothetical protein